MENDIETEESTPTGRIRTIELETMAGKQNTLDADRAPHKKLINVVIVILLKRSVCRWNQAETVKDAHSNTFEYSSFLAAMSCMKTTNAPNGNDIKLSIKLPLNPTLHILALAIPPKKIIAGIP